MDIPRALPNKAPQPRLDNLAAHHALRTVVCVGNGCVMRAAARTCVVRANLARSSRLANAKALCRLALSEHYAFVLSDINKISNVLALNAASEHVT